jgi:hypothetical protein
MITIIYTVIILSLILSCFEIEDPISRFSPTVKKPRNRKGQWTRVRFSNKKVSLPLEITRVQRPRFRRLDERTLVRV